MKESAVVFALVGNPNTGKTSLFNALTGLRQKVGNYAGVTVERKTGYFRAGSGQKIELIDLPGTYSLVARSPDEHILVDVLLGKREDTATPDGVLLVVDASNLERNLYLGSQVLELGIPVVIALNMVDVARDRGLDIDEKKLSELTGARVVACSARKGEGIAALRAAMESAVEKRSEVGLGHLPAYPQAFLEAAAQLEMICRHNDHRPANLICAEARLWLLREQFSGIEDPVSTQAKLWQQRLDAEEPGWRSRLIIQRYKAIGEWMQASVHHTTNGYPGRSQAVDRILLHPVWGMIILGVFMVTLFYSIFSLAETPMEWIDLGIGVASGVLSEALPEGAIRGLVVDGVLAGVGAVVIFLPQILLLFFFIGLFESTGYMARAAFLLDRLMGKVGLHGRSFIPLLSSYACAVPGIMATRTIDSARDRMVTILIAPFMTCSARLPVYLMVIGLLIPTTVSHAALLKAGLLFGLYVMGAIAAFGCAYLIRKTLLRGRDSSMILELPPYRLPGLTHVVREMWQRAWQFLQRAGTIIFVFSLVLWFLLHFPAPPEDATESPLQYSFAGRAGQAVEPIFSPWDTIGASI
ncbi:MAG: ferrous iron transport protein B [Verrucomicrobia bacterium]|nr:ferrous iron transport protein B [Verrucomicrobiota bacterium]